jgi:hypothetical protein
MEISTDSKIKKLKRKKQIWESANGKWRIVQWPFRFTLSIERFVQTKKYLAPKWKNRDIEDADVPKCVLRKLYALLRLHGYVYNLFNTGY